MRTKYICSAAVALLLSVYCPVVVAAASDEVKVKSVQISTPTATVRVNQTRSLSAYVLPLNADDQQIDWYSSNNDVAIVDGEGTVTAVSPGTAVITATSLNNKTAECVVTVPSTVLSGIPQDIKSGDLPLSGQSSGGLLAATELRTAVESAIRAAQGGDAGTLRYQDKTYVSAAALRGAAFTAAYEKGSAALCFDTMKGESNSVQGRLMFDIDRAADTVIDLNPAIWTDAAKTDAVHTKFTNYFSNGMAVIACGQPGDYGLTVEIAAKIDFSGMDTNNLHLYSYNDTGTYILLQNASYWIDNMDYLHFSTDRGGWIIISDGVLAKK